MNILKSIWETWKRVGQFIGDILARIVLTLFYFTLFAPFGIIMRLFNDPLNIKHRIRTSFWLDRDTTDLDIKQAWRQF